jgi:voltage-gated potassium channel
MDKKLAAISSHFIVCGYGRVGRVVCEEFARHRQPFVLIERNHQIIEDVKSRDFLYVHGDCTDDQVLISAGIQRAKGLINAIADEADAVYITLSARQHNSGLFIMARADSIPAEQKLKRAGADRVISPQVAAGTRMALAAMRPNVVDFMAIAVSDEKDGLRIEEVVVSSGSSLIGKSFKEIDIRAKYGLNVIGIKRADGQIVYNPTADHIIETGETLIMVGGGGQLSRIDELCAAPETIRRPR